MDEVGGWLEVAVQHKGIEVGTVGPHDGPELVVYPDLREEVWIGERLKHGAVQLSCEIYISRAAIAEADPQPVVPKHLCGGNPHEIHRIILRQRVDRLRCPTALRSGPVCFKLAAVQVGPLCHEFERASRQATDEHFAAPDCDHRVVLGVLGVKMRRFVIVEVHRDRDAVEEADSGHAAMMVGAWDGFVDLYTALPH
jgi:hypothetical protein